MKSLHKTLVLSLVMASSLPNWAGGTRDRLSLRHIKAVRPDTTLNLLDSIVSDSYRKIYRYNEYGYITSMKVYNKAADWELDTKQSYEQTYAFNAGGQCTERVRYSLKPDGQRDKMTNKGAIMQEGEYTWERYWDTDLNGHTYPDNATGYDRWGNRAIYIDYGYDTYDETHYTRSYHEKRFSGKMPPVNNYVYDDYEDALLIYEVKASNEYDRLSIQRAYKRIDETGNGMFIRRTYRDYSYNSTLDNIDWEPWDSIFYTLNDAGTRPISKLHEGEITDTWEWDDKGRLTKHTDQVSGNTESYTYADDYACQRSLLEVINDVWGIYPENLYEGYGHVATYHSEDRWGHEDQKMEYDSQGRMKRATYTEVDDGERKGTITMYYRPDGHLDYKIDARPDPDDEFYYKEAYVYDSEGVWTGVIEYEGESENGPWHEIHSSSSYKQKGMRLQHEKKHRIGEDLSEGSHEIDETDGRWQRKGGYYVENGEITFGEYAEYLTWGGASVPDDPELNYTDPVMPLDSCDDYDSVSRMSSWFYRWNRDSKQWELEYAPSYDYYVYKDGNQIKRDIYNSQKEITGTDIYSFDDAGRLVKEEWSGNSGYREYTYLDDGSNYLSTRYSYSNTGAGELRRYYYSNHRYVTPTDIDSVGETDKACSPYYDLQGRKVSRPSRGIYIRQGRKVLVR